MSKESIGKDVIYIDVDDEITGIIEKLRGSKEKIVALVLPKRATMLQSIVNMKLLKRSGESAGKHIVLITSEHGLLPLAGSAGLHVAKSLQSKPEIPEAPAEAEDKAETVEETDEVAEGKPLDKSKTVGELTGEDEDEPIELDNATEEPPASGKAAGAKPKKGGKFKIPNFSKFRLWLVFGGAAAVVLIGFVIWALIALPNAKIVVSTDSSAITSSRELLFDTGEGATLDAEEGVVPAKAEQTSRTQRNEVPATGQENKGDTATGGVVMTVERCAPNINQQPSNVPAGSGVSTGGKTYITQENASFSNFQFTSGSCGNYSTNSVSIAAQSGGASYNVNNQDFSVAGRSGVSATGSASGGTDDIVKVVTQEDIDKAKAQTEDQDADEVKAELNNTLTGAGLMAIEETFSVSASGEDLSAQPGDEAENVTVTQEITYSMTGVKTSDLEKAIAEDVASEIDPAKQAILDYGLDEASFTLQNNQDDGLLVGVRTVVLAGPDIDVEELKKAVAGKKASEARTIIEANPGVTNVDISYGPFWVKSIPGNTGKITVTIEEPQAAEESNEQ